MGSEIKLNDSWYLQLVLLVKYVLLVWPMYSWVNINIWKTIPNYKVRDICSISQTVQKALIKLQAREKVASGKRGKLLSGSKRGKNVSPVLLTGCKQGKLCPGGNRGKLVTSVLLMYAAAAGNWFLDLS